MTYLTVGCYDYYSSSQKAGKRAIGHLYTIVFSEGRFSTEV